MDFAERARRFSPVSFKRRPTAPKIEPTDYESFKERLIKDLIRQGKMKKSA